MFIEDVRNYVLPLRRGWSKRKDFAIILDPPDKEGEKIISEVFISREGYTGYDFTETIKHFISENAQLLTLWGLVHYEKNYGINSTQCDSVSNSQAPFRLLMISSKLYKVLNWTIQFISPNHGRKHKTPYLISIPSKLIWSLSIPEKLGGPQKVRRMLKSLQVASLSVPEFVNHEMNREIQKGEYKLDLGLPEFSFGDFHRLQKTVISHETLIWGWPIRTILTDDTLEYYRIHRQIKFAQAMAILREYILERMNWLINIELSSSNLKFVDLPSFQDLIIIEDEWRTGKTTLEEVYTKIGL